MKSVLICSLLLAALVASAQPQGGPPPGGEYRGPLPEALAACKALKAGADCAFAQGNRTTKGTCWTPEASKPLACRPKDMPPPPPGGASAPPPPR